MAVLWSSSYMRKNLSFWNEAAQISSNTKALSSMEDELMQLNLLF